MAQNGRPKNRAYSPYAVDSLEPTELSRDQSNFNGSQMNSAYSNLNLAQSQENISRNPVNTFKGSYQNPAYENAEVAHQYEDPSHLVGANPAPSTGPRRKRNLLYEPTDINRTDDEQVGKDDFGEEVGGDSWLSRLILFLILMISLTSLLLVVLIVVGKVGPSCNSCSEEKAAAPREAQLGGSDSTNEPSNVVTPPQFSSLEDKISELRANISFINTFINSLQRDIQGTKGDLTNTNRNINGTKDKLSQIEGDTKDSIDKIQNISNQLDASVSAINVTFFEQLASVKTSFDSKLNNTAQNLLDADQSLQTFLNTINSSLSAQVQSIGKLQGDSGPRGFNGSKGDPGQIGPTGPPGFNGSTGDKGDRGDKGDPGINGTHGADGAKGDAGLQGDKGGTGAQGPQGPPGPRGPQGPQGAGNFSQCVYTSDVGIGSSGNADVDVIEQLNEKFLGVTCSTTNAQEYNLNVVKRPDNLYVYRCSCKGTSALFTESGSTTCLIHYWVCPLTT